jgi:hypothetical protein
MAIWSRFVAGCLHAGGMFVLAAATTIERLHEIPSGFWMALGAGVLLLVLSVMAVRKLAKMNKVILGFLACIAASFFGFNWIYERNEPGWATPAVSFLAGFFPSKGHLDRG